MEYTGILPLNLQFFADGGEEPGVRQPVNTPSPPCEPCRHPLGNPAAD